MKAAARRLGTDAGARLSRVAAAVLAGGSVGAAAKAYTGGAAGRQSVAHAVGGALGPEWTEWAARARAGLGTAGAWATPRLAAWIALAAVLGVAAWAAARAVSAWRRERAATAAGAGVAGAGAPPQHQSTARPFDLPNHSDARGNKATQAMGRVRATTRATMGAATAIATAAADGLRHRAARRPAPPALRLPHALAANGAAPVDIARRTGLSRDAVALALHLAARRGTV